jgi:hypothetical protein
MKARSAAAQSCCSRLERCKPPNLGAQVPAKYLQPGMGNSPKVTGEYGYGLKIPGIHPLETLGHNAIFFGIVDPGHGGSCLKEPIKMQVWGRDNYL